LGPWDGIAKSVKNEGFVRWIFWEMLCCERFWELLFSET
jgi:hypothetical protein